MQKREKEQKRETRSKKEEQEKIICCVIEKELMRLSGNRHSDASIEYYMSNYYYSTHYTRTHLRFILLVRGLLFLIVLTTMKTRMCGGT